MFQCYSEETIDDRFLDFSIFKENSETKYTDHSSSIKVKKGKETEHMAKRYSFLPKLFAMISALSVEVQDCVPIYLSVPSVQPLMCCK